MAIYSSIRLPTGAAVSAAGTNTVSSWIPMNHGSQPFNVGFGTRTAGGPFTYSVEHTFMDVSRETSGTETSAVAFRHADVSLKVSGLDGNFAFPVRYIRLAIATVAVSGNLYLDVIQTGW